MLSDLGNVFFLSNRSINKRMTNRQIRRPSKTRACIIPLPALDNLYAVLATLGDLIFIWLYRIINCPISKVAHMTREGAGGQIEKTRAETAEDY